MADIDVTTLWRNTGKMVPVLGSSGRFLEREQVPDTRLQVIVDTWNDKKCEHESIDEHRVFPTEHSIPTDYICSGSPEFRTLMATLTKEDS